ncbi:DUF3712 domain-containing protein [Aspergillus melleus]|uniref:DUF3712 domain-containing protein n=1 Tax=Aspergillus melleus TaxID=138277 RepID=UPI001E8EB2AD|nr:uncharacterized protein LDX57_002889 [Aspergillus melleus]KAH8425140.1 hypothetical protein LDX57_002889 [Aspergillus melleus]
MSLVYGIFVLYRLLTMPVGDAYRSSHKHVLGANRGDMDPSAKSKDVEKTKKFVDGSSEHVEAVHDTEKLGKRQQAKRHFRRFWCCYLLAAIIFLAIFLPILFLVIIPAIAQRIVNDTDLPVYSAEILDPKPDRFTFSLNTALDIPAGLSVRTDPLTLRLFNRAVKPILPYLSVDLLGYNLKGHTKMEVTQHDTIVENEDEWVEALTQAVYSKRFKLSAKGSTTAHLGALKADLTLDKDVELDGLDQLSGFSIDSARLLLPAEADGTNLRGEAVLPNHSVVTFALGNVTLNLKSQDLLLGEALIQNVILKPGNNTVALSGRLDIRTILQNLSKIVAAQREAILKGEIELSAQGNKTVYDGQRIPYFERVLNNLTLTARVPIVGVLMDTLQGLGGGNGSVWRNIESLGDSDSLSGLLNGL